MTYERRWATWHDAPTKDTPIDAQFLQGVEDALVENVAPVFNVVGFGATGDSTTDDTAAIQAAIDACDANRGGTVFFPQGRYRIASGLTVSKPGTRLLGEGLPGQGRDSAYHSAQGSSRIISDNGITAITCNYGSHSTLGFAFENLHLLAASGSTSGNGITIEDAERTLIRNITCSDYEAGYGLRLNGSNTQYAELVNYSAGDCLYGLYLVGGAANGVRIWGGYYEGVGHTPRSGSVGIWVDTGDTCRIFGVVIQGYETGIFLDSPGNGHQVYGPRFEYCNIGLRVGSTSVGTLLVGGSWSNTLLAGGGSSIGIQVDSGATNTVLLPGYMSSDVTTKVSDAGTDTLQWANHGSQPFVFFPGTVGVNGAGGTQMAGGVGVAAFKNAETVPSGTPTGGGVLYVEGGALKYRGSSNTVTTLGVA